MGKKVPVLLVLFLVGKGSLPAEGQTYFLEKLALGDLRWGKALGVSSHQGQDFLVVGVTGPEPETYLRRGWLMALAADGKPQWLFLSRTENEFQRALALPNSWLVAGTTFSPQDQPVAQLFKVDLAGHLLWQESWEPLREPVSLAALGGGDFLLGGQVETQPGETQPWLARIGENGTLVWQKNFALSGAVLRDVCVAPDGFALAVGTRLESQEETGFAALFSPQGSLLWAKSFLAPSALSGCAASAQGFLVVGSVKEESEREWGTYFYRKTWFGWLDREGGMGRQWYASGPGNEGLDAVAVADGWVVVAVEDTAYAHVGIYWFSQDLSPLRSQDLRGEIYFAGHGVAAATDTSVVLVGHDYDRYSPPESFLAHFRGEQDFVGCREFTSAVVFFTPGEVQLQPLDLSLQDGQVEESNLELEGNISFSAARFVECGNLPSLRPDLALFGKAYALEPPSSDLWLVKLQVANIGGETAPWTELSVSLPKVVDLSNCPSGCYCEKFYEKSVKCALGQLDPGAQAEVKLLLAGPLARIREASAQVSTTWPEEPGRNNLLSFSNLLKTPKRRLLPHPGSQGGSRAGASR